MGRAAVGAGGLDPGWLGSRARAGWGGHLWSPEGFLALVVGASWCRGLARLGGLAVVVAGGGTGGWGAGAAHGAAGGWGGGGGGGGGAVGGGVAGLGLVARAS